MPLSQKNGQTRPVPLSVACACARPPPAPPVRARAVGPAGAPTQPGGTHSPPDGHFGHATFTPRPAVPAVDEAPLERGPRAAAPRHTADRGLRERASGASPPPVAFSGRRGAPSAPPRALMGACLARPAAVGRSSVSECAGAKVRA